MDYMVGRKLSFVSSPMINTFRVPKIEKNNDSCPQVSLKNNVNQAPALWTNFNNINTTGHILSKVKTIKTCPTVIIIIFLLKLILLKLLIAVHQVQLSSVSTDESNSRASSNLAYIFYPFNNPE